MEPPSKTTQTLIRRATPEESDTLTELTLRSKAYWGYSQVLIEKWRAIMSVSPELIRNHPVYVAENSGRVCGYYSLEHPDGDQIMLENLFIDPEFMGSGAGRALLHHALALAASLGYRSVCLESDPHAEGFYLKMGAVRTGERAAPIPGQPERVLPKMRINL
jgi:N-acetylglutamate synthase-like GNAT family acetyltransferase